MHDLLDNINPILMIFYIVDTETDFNILDLRTR